MAMASKLVWILPLLLAAGLVMFFASPYISAWLHLNLLQSYLITGAAAICTVTTAIILVARPRRR